MHPLCVATQLCCIHSLYVVEVSRILRHRNILSAATSTIQKPPMVPECSKSTASMIYALSVAFLPVV